MNINDPAPELPPKPIAVAPKQPSLEDLNAERILRIVHAAVRAARLRINDGRARESMAMFEHEMLRHIDQYFPPRKEDLRK